MPTIKKVKIPNASLPAINGETGSYLVRYRIISEDKNRTSQWSPTYSILPEYSYTSGDVSYATLGNSVVVSWEEVSNGYGNVSKYDVWVNWDNSGWSYSKTTSTNSVTMIVPAGALSYSIRVYAEINPPTELDAHRLYEQLTITL